MAPCLVKGRTCFGSQVSGSPRQLFGDRLNVVSRMIKATVQNDGDNQKPSLDDTFLFWTVFFNTLLQEWLSGENDSGDIRLPLPGIKQSLVPAKLMLSHFWVDNARKKDIIAISEAIDSREPFAGLAKKYGEDHCIRAFGGRARMGQHSGNTRRRSCREIFEL